MPNMLTVHGGAYSVVVDIVGRGLPRTVLTVPELYDRGSTVSPRGTVSFQSYKLVFFVGSCKIT